MRRCGQCQLDFPDALEFCPNDGHKLPPLPGDTQSLYDPLIGATIDGRYQVESVLGEGGMGMVYAGRHAIIDKRVAIKVLRKEAATDESAAQRFLAEAKAASKIGQQNIVDITDFGVLPDGHAYFVMEFLDGPTLGKLLKDETLSPARAVGIVLQVGRGLAAAHAKGIVHRDLKPENIFVLDRDGAADFCKIVDFGIARDTSAKKRLTVAGMVMGTPEYMAPEQASGQETDHRVDQYALGCILYEALTGVTPFRGDNPMQTLTRHVFDAVVPPTKQRPDLQIPVELEAVVMRTLAKKRDDRYPDIDQMMKALQALVPSLQGLAPAPRAPSATAEPEEAGPTTVDASRAHVPVRRGGRTVAGIVAALGVAGLAAVLMHQRTGGSPSPAPVVTPTVAPPVQRSGPPVAPKPVPQVEIALDSVPGGAEVFLGDELIGSTPTKTMQPRDDAAQLTFVFRKPGFRDTPKAVLAAKDAYLQVVLLREPTPVKRPASPTVPVGVATKPETTKPASPESGAKPGAKPVKKPLSELRNPFDDAK